MSIQKLQGFRRKDHYYIASEPVKQFISETLSEWHVGEMYWSNTKNENMLIPDAAYHQGVVNVQRINDITRINKFFEHINRSIDTDKYLIINLETKEARKQRILKKFPKIISYPYYLTDFVLKRAFPKWKATRKAYFSITKGRNRVLSLTEGLGRLFSCGFEVLDYKEIGYNTWVIAQKKRDPYYDMEPTYGMLCGLKRIGKGGKIFTVKKLRTMHPYSEYLQDFAFRQNSLEKGGKIKDDFRVTNWGKIFRKLWIDELPMLINFVRGQMKFVGVRPLSQHYFSLYPEELQQLRIQVKPGLVPPFYADMPETLGEIVESEKRYLESYLKAPLRTDVTYFLKAFYNIFIKKARSR